MSLFSEAFPKWYQFYEVSSCNEAGTTESPMKLLGNEGRLSEVDKECLRTLFADLQRGNQIINWCVSFCDPDATIGREIVENLVLNDLKENLSFLNDSRFERAINQGIVLYAGTDSPDEEVAFWEAEQSDLNTQHIELLEKAVHSGLTTTPRSIRVLAGLLTEFSPPGRVAYTLQALLIDPMPFSPDNYLELSKYGVDYAVTDKGIAVSNLRESY